MTLPFGRQPSTLYPKGYPASAPQLSRIAPLNADMLATLAIESARHLDNGRDGISYLLNAKRNGIVTPLSVPYEQEILRRTETTTLEGALKKIRVRA